MAIQGYKVTDYGGFLFLVNEPRRAARFRRDVAAGLAFTDAVSDLDWHLYPIEVFLISLTPTTIDYACLARPGSRVARSKSHIAFSHFVELDPEIEFHEVEHKLPLRVRALVSSSMGNRIVPETWEKLLTAIKQIRPGSSEAIDGLEQRRRGLLLADYKPGTEVVAEEKDAVNLALRVSGFDHDKHLRWKRSDQALAPFLQGLESVELMEDAMIEQDAHVFGDWGLLHRNQVGGVVFCKGDERLTIMNVNRRPIERTLGVDLLYYHHKYHGYIMVQYKRMLDESGKWIYRPADESFYSELERMRDFEKLLLRLDQEQTTMLDEFRLHPGFFFFKLCHSTILDPLSTDMIPGTYIPLVYLEALLQSTNIKGPRGGLQLTDKNIGRNFSNTLFVDLVQNGWIGSRGLDSAMIGNVVNAVLDSGRSIILAARQATSPRLFW